MTTGAAAKAAEVRKHTANDQKCIELGWSFISCCGVIWRLGQRSPGVLHTLSSKSKTTFNLLTWLCSFQNQLDISW